MIKNYLTSIAGANKKLYKAVKSKIALKNCDQILIFLVCPAHSLAKFEGGKITVSSYEPHTFFVKPSGPKGAYTLQIVFGGEKWKEWSLKVHSYRPPSWAWCYSSDFRAWCHLNGAVFKCEHSQDFWS